MTKKISELLSVQNQTFSPREITKIQIQDHVRKSPVQKRNSKNIPTLARARQVARSSRQSIIDPEIMEQKKAR